MLARTRVRPGLAQESAVIRVSRDHGDGVPEDALENVFGRFTASRIHRERSSEGLASVSRWHAKSAVLL